MSTEKKQKIAVVLFNLGGPNSLTAVKPFLFNLFNDRAIINLPQPFRFLLAKAISIRRDPHAQEIYKKIGGMSPLLENTQRQASALEKKLKPLGNVRCFIAMRYWHPFANEAAEAVKAFDPEKIILLPLYPQFSTTTSASSMENWKEAAQKKGLCAKTSSICCFPRDPDFVKSHIETIKPHLKKALAGGNVRILFSAHGLPEKVVADGDPYVWQVEETVRTVVAGLRKDPDLDGASFDHVVCYQSRVGPMKWLEPSTENEIKRAGEDGKNLLVVPIAFVSEHSETLVELDMNNLALANTHKIKHYTRVPALATSPAFIDALAGLIKGALGQEGVRASAGNRICPEGFSGCPCKEQS